MQRKDDAKESGLITKSIFNPLEEHRFTISNRSIDFPAPQHEIMGPRYCIDFDLVSTVETKKKTLRILRYDLVTRETFQCDIPLSHCNNAGSFKWMPLADGNHTISYATHGGGQMLELRDKNFELLSKLYWKKYNPEFSCLKMNNYLIVAKGQSFLMFHYSGAKLSLLDPQPDFNPIKQEGRLAGFFCQHDMLITYSNINDERQIKSFSFDPVKQQFQLMHNIDGYKDSFPLGITKEGDIVIKQCLPVSFWEGAYLSMVRDKDITPHPYKKTTWNLTTEHIVGEIAYSQENQGSCIIMKDLRKLGRKSRFDELRFAIPSSVVSFCVKNKDIDILQLIKYIVQPQIHVYKAEAMGQSKLINRHDFDESLPISLISKNLLLVYSKDMAKLIPLDSKKQATEFKLLDAVYAKSKLTSDGLFISSLLTRYNNVPHWQRGYHLDFSIVKPLRDAEIQVAIQENNLLPKALVGIIQDYAEKDYDGVEAAADNLPSNHQVTSQSRFDAEAKLSKQTLFHSAPKKNADNHHEKSGPKLGKL